MNPTIVSKKEPITLVGGAEISRELFFEAAQLGTRIIAADGGANRVLAFGAMPEAVIGDMDSIEASDRAQISADRIIPVAEQDSTDFEKVLQRVNAPICLGVGFLGGRVDHELAALSALVRYADRKVILIGEQDIIFVLPQRFAIDLSMDERVSLFPFGACDVTSVGLYWPTNGLRFHPKSQIGTSNKATGPIELICSDPNMLLILPRETLVSAMDALILAPEWRLT